jgi:hypothetical protein
MNRYSILFKYFLILGMQGVVLTSCIFPLRSFEKGPKPKPPDYSKSESWAALPDKKDNAHLTIPNTSIVDKQSEAKVDVFFIHPTTYRLGAKWNGSITNRRVNKRTDNLPIRYQASVFNGSCKVYAPRYRQASLVTYIDKKGNGPKVFDLAYQDVKQAFLYYLKNYNNGRPFIIASHSQGTDHAYRLINEFIKKDSVLYKQFVVAYLMGRPIKKETITVIEQCKSAEQYGCFNIYNAVPWGTDLLFRTDFGDLLCNNPITWKADTCYASAELNKGSLPLGYKNIDMGVADAKVSLKGLLWVHRPKNKTNKDYMYVQSESFHNIEYSLFYMNIRENVKQRIDAYFLDKNP